MYFGTNTGELYASADEGDSWHCLAQHLPLITSVETLVVEADPDAGTAMTDDNSSRAAPPVVVVLPPALVRLFPTAPRRLEVSASTVNEVIEALDGRWPGMRDQTAIRRRASGATSTSSSRVSGRRWRPVFCPVPR